MRKTWRKLLSVLLALSMVVSLTVTGYAAGTDNGSASRAALELEKVDPSTLDVSRVGQVNKGESLIDEALPYKASDIVRVSIVLDGAATLEKYSAQGVAYNNSAVAYRASLKHQQEALTMRIEKALGRSIEVKWNLTLAMNAISANVRYGDLEAIRNVAGVKSVELENRYEPQVGKEADEPNNGAASYMIGSNLTWANGYTGAGSKVAVIDTGIDSEHLSFSGEALEYALAQTAAEKGISYDEYVASLNLLTPESIDAVKDQLNANIGSGSAAYRNTKIGYGYNYVDDDVAYIEHMQDSQGEHGSHVEGIAAANRFVKVDGEFQPALTAVGTQGVAPDAQIVTMKVFGKGGGAYDSDYMVAIEDAIILGCDSANLSLGSGSAGFSFSGSYENVMNELVENSLVVAMSAGNSYAWYDTPYNSAMYPYLYAEDMNYATGGSPGSFTNSLGVASVDNLGQTGKPLMFGDLAVFYSETGYGCDPIVSLADQDLEYIFFENFGADGNGNSVLTPYADAIAGKVVLCSRGTSSFYQKVNAAAAAGAIACIIYNNQPGVINMNLEGVTTHIPAVSITQADGQAIKAQSEAVTAADGSTYYTGSMSVSADLQVLIPEVTDTVTVSSFSSWGAPGSMVLKPEILAPGGNIYSVWGANTGASSPTNLHDQYESMSGTSMASPQVAGMAAVMGQYIRDNNLTEKTGLTARQLTNSLLMSTAHPVFDANGDYWPVIRVGAGLGNVSDATNAQSYILMDENATIFPDSANDGKVKAELGDDPDYSGEYSYKFTLYPLEGSKEFTLRTDIFTQWLAGNGGYGMLQDQGTVLLGSEVTYEVNGETYGDSFTVEADVNGDGETDAQDAQAILDNLTGAAAEDAAFDAEAADVDGDGSITSYDAKLILESAATPIISISEPTEITVNITVDPGDVAYLLRYCTKGFYIQGYTYVDPVADDEGNMDVVHSIPIFGFLGNWTDPAMLDRTSAIDDAYGTGKLPYLNNTNINYLTLKDAAGNTRTYMGNPYMVEDKFPADRLAMNSEDTIQAFNYLPIRNVATLGFGILDENGEVLFANATATQRYAPYYYVNGGVWQNTGSSNYNVGKKLSTAGVKEGDVVTVGFYALPEYYGILNARLNGEVATTGGLDANGLKAMINAGLVGEGAGIQYTVTIDDTAPEVKGALQDLISGDIYVKAVDENYIAYVAITNKSGSQVFFETVPEQENAGEEIEVPLELEGVSLPNDVVLLVADYAGNETAYKVNLGGNGGETESYAGQMFGFVPAGSTYGPGSGNRLWTIDPATASVGTSSYTGVENFANVNFTVTAAEYLDGYVFMAADDGWFYAGALDSLGEASLMGKFSDTVEKIYDMAYNYRNETLYALGNNNTVYSVDVITGEMEALAHVTLPGTSGTSAEANRLAISDDGVFYLGNYGGSSTAKLFKFEIEYEEETTEPETPGVEGDLLVSWGFESDDEFNEWTIVDANNDNSTWTRGTTAPHSGSGHLQNRYMTAGVDDYAVSPVFDLSEAGGAQVSVYLGNNATSYTENFAIYAGTSSDVTAMTQISEKISIALNGYEQHVLDLSDFVGEPEVYVAIRHYDSVDQFRAYADDVAIYTTAPASEEPVEPEEPETSEIEPELVGVMGTPYNYSKGGAFAWDHNTGKLYLVTNYNATNDTDHHLWTVDTATGKATKTNSNSNLRGSVRGLFIVPGRTPTIVPTDEAIDLIVEPETMNLLKGQSDDIKAAALPWTLTDKDLTFESADENIATVKDNIVTAVNVGTTTITVTTVAAPNLTAEVTVNVTLPPAADLRGIVWDEDGKGQASFFNSNDTANWEALSVVGQLRWGALVGETVYGSTDDTMYAFDADTYEVTTLGGIVAMWIPSDADELPQDYIDAFADMGYAVGPVLGLNNSGTYLSMIDPEEGSILYFDFSEDFGGDPMAVISFHERRDYTYLDWNTFSYVTDENCAVYYMMTESGMLYELLLTHDGSANVTEIGQTGLDLTGVADATNSVWASMKYDAENNFLYVSHYDGADDFAYLYAIDAADLSRMSCTGDFNESVWPVTGLYQYEPLTDLTMKVDPTELVLFEGDTATVNIKIKLGETNEYTAEVLDPTVISFEDGVVTGLKEGETDLVITTVDTNEAGEHLTETVHVTVKGLISLEAFVTAQVTDENGTRITKINLEDLTASKRGSEAPFDVVSGGRSGNFYVAGGASAYEILDAETFEAAEDGFAIPDYSSYPPLDIANYPAFLDSNGEYVENHILFPVTQGYVVSPDLYGWNLSSVISGLAGLAFMGTDQNSEGVDVFDYLLLNTAGDLYLLQIDYAAGRIAYQQIMNTGITVTDPTNISMAVIQTLGYEQETAVAKDAGLVIANNENKNVYYVDFNTWEVGMFGTLDADNVSGLIGTFDDLVTTVNEEDMPVDPFEGATEIASFGFEEDPTDWTFVNADGDNYNWAWNLSDAAASWFTSSPDFASMAYEGEGCILSASYVNSFGALYPDNWAISPAIDLSEAEGDLYFSFFAENLDPSYAAENFALYAGTTANPDEMTKLADDFTLTGSWKRYYADISQFAGESEVYVAIRHYDCTDYYIMAVDKVEILAGAAEDAGNSGAIVIEPMDYTAPELALNRVALGSGTGYANVALASAYTGTVEMTRFGETANVSNGGLNTVVNLTASEDTEVPVETENTVVTLTEDVDVANGLYVVNYDPAALTFVDCAAVHDVCSINVDAENGVITLAFADLEAVPAGEAIAELSFTAASCDTTEVTVNTLERNDELGLEESEILEVSGTHAWGEPEWTWAEDFSSATATFTCANNPEHVEIVEAEITSEVSAENANVTIYTATVTGPDGEEYTDTQESVGAVTGWQKIDGKWYYYDENSEAVTGWNKIDGKWYYFNDEGVMQTGWRQIDGKWYYFDGSGAMATKWRQINGKWYHFEDSGAMTTMWRQLGGNWYYFGTSGAMHTGWLKSGNDWYYFNDEGIMQTGWQDVDGHRYYLGTDGIMVTGWQDIDGNRYHFGAYGAMTIGWLKDNNNWYYLQDDGIMAANTSLTINGKVYNFDANGVCTNP
jgi:lactocepin